MHYSRMLSGQPAGYTLESWLPPTEGSLGPITADEVQKAIQSMRNNKALGDSWLSPELLRNLS